MTTPGALTITLDRGQSSTHGASLQPACRGHTRRRRHARTLPLERAQWPVSEVLATWHLMDRWWVRPVDPATATYSLGHGEQDWTYYRVCCRDSAGEQVFDLFHDAVTNQWVLDVAHD